MAKETKEAKHPIFRQFDLDDVVEIVLMDADGEEISVTPGHKSEQEIKKLAQDNGVRGPVNLMARLSNGLTSGPVQISVPPPRMPASSLFRGSRLTGVEPRDRSERGDRFDLGDRGDRGERGDRSERDTLRTRRPVAPAALADFSNSDEIALESVQRLDRFASESMSSERARSEQEREFWQTRVEEMREETREELALAEERYAEQIDRIREAARLAEDRYEQQVARMQEANEQEVARMQQANEQQVARLQQASEQSTEALRKSYEEKLREQRLLEESKIKHLSADSGEKVSLVREMSEQTNKVMESSNAQTIATLKAQLDASVGRIKDLENSREREAETARNRYEDLRDRLTDEVNRLREDKGKAESARLEMMLQSQRSSSEDIRREVDRVTARHETDTKELRTRYEDEIREQRRIIESLRQRADDATTQMRVETGKAEMAMLRAEANREPLTSERLLPMLASLPADQRASLVGRAIASDIGIDYDEGEEKKPSIMDTIGTVLSMVASANTNTKPPPQQAPTGPLPQAPPPLRSAPRPIAQQPQQAPPRPQGQYDAFAYASQPPSPIVSTPSPSSGGLGQTEDV